MLDAQMFTTYAAAIGTAVTAVATIFLWLVTKTLAKETRRMAAASAQPHVVVTIEPNRWSMMHSDLNVENTGNATAYDIRVVFEPPLENGEVRGIDKEIPFQKVSVLKPGQRLSSYLSEYEKLKGKAFTVSISWRRNAAEPEREQNTYLLDMRDVEGMSRLGSSDPLLQIAEEVKHIREDWKRVASGATKVKADVYSSDDRTEERRLTKERHEEFMREQASQESKGTQNP
jgi:hypothetical protein